MKRPGPPAPSDNDHTIESPPPSMTGDPMPHPVDPSGCTITATGRALEGSDPLKAVRGLVVRSGIHASPLPGAVSGNVNPNKIDYSFSAIPGAINDNPNRLFVWAEFSGVSGWKPQPRDFSGTGGGSGCDSGVGGGGGGGIVCAPLFRAAPRFVRVQLAGDWIGDTAPEDAENSLQALAGEGLVLRYDVKGGSPASPLWSLSQPTHQSDFWALRVASVNDSLQAAFSLLRVLKTGGEQLCRWIANGWSFNQRNELAPELNGIGTASLPSLCIEPA